MFQPNREMLAWAAGFYDGEGSVCCSTGLSGKAIRQMHLDVPQAGTEEEPPDTLLRLQAALGGMGVVRRKCNRSKLTRKPLWLWATGKFEHVQAIICFLWPWLGKAKREQAINCLAKYKSVVPKVIRPMHVMGGPKRQRFCMNGHDKFIEGNSVRSGRGWACRICRNAYHRNRNSNRTPEQRDAHLKRRRQYWRRYKDRQKVERSLGNA